LIAAIGQVIVVLVDRLLFQVSNVVRAVIHVSHIAAGGRNAAGVAKALDGAKFASQSKKTRTALESLAASTTRIILAAQNVARVGYCTERCDDALLSIELCNILCIPCIS
jgi:hypothetical protein